MSDPLPRIIDALGLEVTAIRKRGGGTRIELRGGERIGETDGSWLYRFYVGEDLTLRDDTPVRVTCGQEDVSGILVSFRDGLLVVALEKDLGGKIAAARLIANNSFLVERLKERLERVNTGQAQFNRQAADRVLGLAAAQSADADPESTVLEDNKPLNDKQVLAVRRSLGSETTFVWGPPGTGKTTTLARIVEAHYRVGRSILLVSNTNIAVDTALEKIAERLKGAPEFHQGLVIRQGPVVKEELRHKFGPQVILEEIVARLGEVLSREKAELAREAAPLEVEERALATALKDLEQLEHAQRSLAEREKGLATTRTNTSTREREAQQHRVRAAALRTDLGRARTMGAVRRFFSSLNLERLEREIAAADRAAQASMDAARALFTDITRHEVEIRALRSDIDRQAATARTPPTGKRAARKARHSPHPPRPDP